MQTSYAEITLAPGKGKARQYHVPQLESWTTEQSIDNDVDSFSIEVGDVAGELLDALDRDTEVRANLFATDGRNRVQRVFTGLVDVESFSTEKTHTMQGSDVPSAILIGTDALPGYWRQVDPRALLLKRGKALGLANMKIAPMRQIGRLWSDASEKEWSFWYRVARTSGHFMWSDDYGSLIIDNLNYSRSSWAYNFGHPKVGTVKNSWIPVLEVNPVSNKQQRLDEARVYGEDKKKKGVTPIASVNNPAGASIAGWLRRSVAISTLTTARTQKDLNDEAKLQVFESIVGAQEHTLTIGNDVFVQQNETARVNLPEYGIAGVFYVVGVSRSESSDGLTQTVRLRETGYAIDKRVPEAPTLSKQPNLATGTSTANIAESLSGKDGIRWSGAFVRATREFLSGPGTPGWDFSVALGVLLAICDKESSFHNVREQLVGGAAGAPEWHTMPTNTPDQSLSPSNRFDGRPVITAPTLSAAQQEWRKEFANAKGNSLNPFPREAGVGPMQLTTLAVKQWADAYGWSGSPPMSGMPEYAGGRWNPESNIRASARLLAEYLKEMGADPTNSETIWSGVAAYNAGVAGAKAGGGQGYAAAVRKVYKSDYGPDASSAVTSVQKTIPGSAQRVFKDGSGNVIVALPDNTPATVAKAITWAMSQRGNKYQWGGAGNPGYDCSSLVTHALVVGDPTLKSVLDEPIAATGHHGETSFTLWDKGTFAAKADLLPGDLVFFNDGGGVPEGHVGMFIGDGQFIQDPHTGDVVKVSALGEKWYRDNYNGARRFLSWPGGRH